MEWDEDYDGSDDFGYPPPDTDPFDDENNAYDPYDDRRYGSLVEPDWPSRELTDDDAPFFEDRYGQQIEEEEYNFIAVIDFEQARLEDLRGVIFTSALDAVEYLSGIGVISFSRIVHLGDGVFAVEIGKSL